MKTNALRPILSISFIFVGLSQAHSQENSVSEDLITDRPDQTESPSLVSKGSIQIETGFFYENSENQNINEKSYGYNTSLLRYGLLDNLELRMGFDYLETKTELNNLEFGSRDAGFNPLLVGVKVGITKEKGLLAEIGLLGHLHLPFSVSKEVRPETTGVDFRFSFNHTLTENSSISYNLGAQWGEDSPEASYLYTLVYGYDLNEKFGLYLEVYGDLPEDDRSDHFWDAGITYKPKNNIQLDALIGTGIDNSQKLMFGGGISFRLPK
jgi:hypothetical protein